MHTTNYTDTFIQVSDDCKASAGQAPERPGTIAALQYELIAGAPYQMTSDDVIFAVHALRHDIAEEAMTAERQAFFSKGQACLRASPLVKSYGFGIHHDGQGRVALYGVETPQYQELCLREGIAVIEGMRNRRAS